MNGLNSVIVVNSIAWTIATVLLASRGFTEYAWMTGMVAAVNCVIGLVDWSNF